MTITFPKTNITLENGWLEDCFPFGMAYFQRLCYTFREGIFFLNGLKPPPSCVFHLGPMVLVWGVRTPEMGPLDDQKDLN